MFDTTFVASRPAVNVHVDQRPHDTADAARLYGEMERKAEREIVNATIERFGAHNQVTVLRVDSELRICTMEKLVRVMFKLNGETYDFECKADDIGRETFRVIAEKVCENVMRLLSLPRKL